MLFDNIWVKKMVKFLKNRQRLTKKDLKVGIHLDDEEREATELTHLVTLKFLSENIE